MDCTFSTVQLLPGPICVPGAGHVNEDSRRVGGHVRLLALDIKACRAADNILPKINLRGLFTGTATDVDFRPSL